MQQTLLKAKGLYSFPNRLSDVPQGALLEATNAVINRDDIVESRRGFSVYGSSSSSSIKQLITYKGRIIRHYGSVLDFDSDGNGTFVPFQLVFTGTTHSNTTIDGLTSSEQLEVGMTVTGSGIPAGTTITSILSSTSIQISQAATASATVSLTFIWATTEAVNGLRTKSVEQNGNLYFTSSEGIQKISALNASDLSNATLDFAGGIKALDLKLSLSSSPGWFSTQSVVAYRVVWGIKDVNNNEILGSPSQRTVIRNTSGTTTYNVQLAITIPKNITTAHFYQIYRTAVLSDPAQTQDPGDEEQLVYEGNPTQSDINANLITVEDVTPESFRENGAYLYTNQNSGEGILQSNDPPPFAKDIAAFQGYTFYANTKTKQNLNIALLSVSQFVAGTSTLTISDGTTTNTYTFDNTEDVTTKKILISSLSTPAQQVDETARSIVHVINSQLGEIVYAYYTSGPNDVPGLIYLEARTLDQSAFYLTVNSTSTGNEFNPVIPTIGQTVISTDDVRPNRIFYSKIQQPEAVPSTNYIDVGPKDKAILRIVALRDNLFILKEDGVYRLSGLVAPFTVSSFDFSVLIKAADSAVVLNNLIYVYTSQGITTISETGCSVISRPIENYISPLLTSTYTNFSTATFGVSYESDRSYYLFTVTNPSDTYATRCFRFNSFTNTWTVLDLAKRCGIVNVVTDLMYLAPTDINYLEKERKLFDRTDYSDREYSLTLGSGAISGTTITVPSTTNISVGDVVTQIQYLTISQFNALLTKLDNDPILSGTDYYSTLGAVPSSDLSSQLDSLITKIANDAGRTAVVGSTSAATYTAISPTASSFTAQQTNYNALVALLNADLGVGYKNYRYSSGTVAYEFIVQTVTPSADTITSPTTYPLIAGPITVYNHISVSIQWVPQYLEDVSMVKQVSESTLIFEDSSFTNAVLSYSTDLSANFEPQTIPGYGNGLFGNFSYGSALYGGNGSGVPFRTLIPKQKQRCRYINCKFSHAIAREIFSLYGLSLTHRAYSNRGWR